MDLGTIDDKIHTGAYSNIEEFTADVRRVWNNAFTYNSPSSAIYEMAVSMQRNFSRLLMEEGLAVAQTAPPV